MLSKFTVKSTLAEKLTKNSFVAIEPIYSDETIEYLNTKFDQLFLQQNQSRRYVDALDMLNLGVLYDVFNPSLISLIYKLMPNPILYHCHSYEIDGKSQKSHIAGDNFLDGWHRDIDCIHDFEKRGIQHISLFVYLTDVGANDGAFEVCTKKLGYLPRLFKSSKFYSITGKRGHSFLFNRTAFHRASPNKNNNCRRVLKISFQDKNTSSIKLDEKIKSHKKRFNLQKVRDSVPKENVIIRSLFGDEKVNNEELRRAIESKNLSSINYGFIPESTFEIKYSMSLLKEFRGAARDLMYLKKMMYTKKIKCR
ncbi:phytanoyl-CoA dioxygenase family protein [Pseudoalteromonas gelatinilytica]